MKPKRRKRLSESLTFKAAIIASLVLILLIPNVMIRNLIEERKARSIETIDRINAKWSNAQTLCGPILLIPYTTTYLDGKQEKFQKHTLNIAPDNLTIDAKLYPEERYYGIYKTILYKSKMNILGKFGEVSQNKIENSVFHWEEAYISIGVSDLRGVSEDLDFVLDGKKYTAEVAGMNDIVIGQGLIVRLDSIDLARGGHELKFSCNLNLNGSSDLNFFPIGKTTNVKIAGDWRSPGFVGNFTPEYTINENSFEAEWKILSFNRSIPGTWTDVQMNPFYEASFGVNLVDTVDHYQQNDRSAKYAVMFIALTFVIFFFVEVITKKRIHPIQYLLVAIALILFYSLLLSISEQIGFGLAYLISSAAIISLITLYVISVFKNKTQAAILGIFLSILYVFLYGILQLEDIALLIGSIGLFFILAAIMFFSRKVNWYKQEEPEEAPETTPN